MMKKKLFTLLFVAALILTGCGYKKPETHTMLGINLNSITTVCGTDCTMDEIDIQSANNQGTATYVYTDVADNRGIEDAKKYHEYLKTNEHCIKIDDFDEKKGYYIAYFHLVSDKDKEGFRMNVSFKKDAYTIQITDNVNLEDL